LDRNTQFNTWLFTGKPHVFWLTGFFNPQVNELNDLNKILKSPNNFILNFKGLFDCDETKNNKR